MSGTAQSVKPGFKPTSAKPTAAKGEEKKAPKRIQHPLIGNADPNVYPFTSAPADFDGRKHFPLKKKDFKEEYMFYEWRLSIARQNVEKLEKAVAEAKATGGSKDKAGAKRLVKMAQRLSDLQQKLAAKNVDVGSILKNAGVDLDFLQTLLASAKNG